MHKSQIEYSRQFEDCQNNNQSSVRDQPFIEKKPGKDSAPGVVKLKKDTKNKKKRIDCSAMWGGDCRQEQENVNMNRQYDAALSKEETTTTLSQRDIIGESCVFEVKPSGQNLAGENLTGSKRQKHTATSARSKLSIAKRQIKKLVKPNNRKITVFEPKKVDDTSAHADILVNKKLTDNTQSEASSRVNQRHKTKCLGNKGKKDKSLNVETTNSVPLVKPENEVEISEIPSSVTTEVSTDTGISQALKRTKPSTSTHRNMESAQLITSQSNSTFEDMADPENYKNMTVAKAHQQDRIQPLSKQGTFLIEKPKLAWSSPTLRSKCIHSVMVNHLQGSLTDKPLQVETPVTSLRSPKSEKLVSDEDDQNEDDDQMTGIVGTSYARDEHSKLLHKAPRMLQSYSNSSVDTKDDSDEDSDEDVVDGNVNVDKDSEEDSEGDVIKSVEVSGREKDTSNIHYDPLSWVITSNDKDVPSSIDETKVSQDQDIDSKNCSSEQKKKISRLKKIRKSFAKLPKGISENFMNILPSSSIFLNMPKFKSSRVGKVNVTDVPENDRETKSTSIKREDESSAEYETVTMRHASMQTNLKKSRAATRETL